MPDYIAFRYGDKRGRVSFFSNTRDYAEEYAAEKGGTSADVREVEIKLSNPLIVNTPDGKFSDPAFEKQYIDKALKNGNDGVIFRNGTDEFYVVFSRADLDSLGYME